jgi:hypothetical protein
VSNPHTIELQYFPDCPHWQLAARRLEEVAAKRGLQVSYRVIDTEAEAEEVGFRGSPTILIDGHDPYASPDTVAGLSCRLYDTPEGIAGSPTIDQLNTLLAE